MNSFIPLRSSDEKGTSEKNSLLSSVATFQFVILLNTFCFNGSNSRFLIFNLFVNRILIWRSFFLLFFIFTIHTIHSLHDLIEAAHLPFQPCFRHPLPINKLKNQNQIQMIFLQMFSWEKPSFRAVSQLVLISLSILRILQSLLT